MTAWFAWIACLAAPPLAIIGASHTRLHVERLRAVAVASAATTLLVSAVVALAPGQAGFAIPWPGHPGAILGDSVLRLDALSSLIVPLPAGLWLLTVAVTPRARLDRAGIRRTAAATLTTTSCFLTTSPLLLVALWTLSVWAFVAALSAPPNRHARNVTLCYLGASTASFAAGVTMMTMWPAGSSVERAGVWLVLAAALLRKGIFPFHAWIPETFDRGRIGPAVLFSAPQVGAYVTAVLVVPRASPEALRLGAILALVTAVYGAALATFQRDARRACGYLFVSQSALVMTGLESTNRLAVAGSLVLWISSAVAFTGISRCVLVLEARRGRLDLSRYHGGFAQTPLLATSFLVLALACTGFPGTLGFVGQELLVEGAVQIFPVVGLLVVLAGAFTGLAALRMYFSLFCGKRVDAIHLRLLPREVVCFVTASVLLIAVGLAPAPIVAAELAAGDGILRARARAPHGSPRDGGGGPRSFAPAQDP